MASSSSNRKSLSLSDFNYEYSLDRVATQPVEPRSSSLLLDVDTIGQQLVHRRALDLSEILSPGDLVVLNASPLVRARFRAKRKTGGQLEGIYLDSTKTDVRVWIAGTVQVNEWIELESAGDVQILERREREVILKISGAEFLDYLAAHGLPALPPYIRACRRELGLKEEMADDPRWYQPLKSRAVSSDASVSVAAPTASLHFDEALFQSLEKRGIECGFIELDVGEGTFAPLESEDLDQIHLHSERVRISSELWSKVQTKRNEEKRVVAVGTTVLRALESAALREKQAEAIDSYSTDLFIRPGFNFNVVDTLMTNFHQPESSLLVLVSAFLEFKNGPDWKIVYQEALREKYRLFSFGDAMVIR